MKKTALIIAAAAVLAAGLATESRACATCGCSAPKVPVAKAACQADCQKACCAATVKAACTAGDSAKCSAAQKAACGADCAKQCCAAGKAPSHEYATVDTDGLKKLVDSDEKITLVDARFGKYDDGRRIGDAKQVGSGASDEQIAAALPDKEAKIVAYCSNTKCGASAKLAHRLVGLGYKNVAKYPDGIDGWVAAGNDVTKK